MRLRNTFRTLVGILGTVFIGATITMFLVFPRVANLLAEKLGNMGSADQFPYVEWGPGLLHLAIALIIDGLLAYFFIWRPTKRLRESFEVSGLMIRKGEGRAFIDPESVRQQVLAAIAKVTDIKRADVNIANDDGKAVIQLNIITDISLNGPKKKNEINREVRKIVEDQLGIEIAGKPTINFTLASEGGVPLITSGSGMGAMSSGSMSSRMPSGMDSSDGEVVTPPGGTPIPTHSPMPIYGSGIEAPPPPQDEPEEAHAYKKPTGIELAKTDPFAPKGTAPKPLTDDDTIPPASGSAYSGSSLGTTSGESAPDDISPFRTIPKTEIVNISDTPHDMPSADDLTGSSPLPSDSTDDKDKLAGEG